MARAESHRVVPVYLNGWPSNESHVPYGLRIKNGLSLPDAGGFQGVACKLEELLAQLERETSAASGQTPIDNVNLKQSHGGAVSRQRIGELHKEETGHGLTGLDNPAHSVNKQTSNKPSKPQLAGKRILIVEDDRMLAEHLQAQLQQAGCFASFAFSQVGALKKLQQNESAFDVAILDFYIPMNDGGRPQFDIAPQLAEELHQTSPDLYIIGLSNYFHELTGRAISKHFNAFIQKRDLFFDQGTPSNKLVEVIETHLRSFRKGT